jgi:hypothetical protein
MIENQRTSTLEPGATMMHGVVELLRKMVLMGITLLSHLCKGEEEGVLIEDVGVE